MWYLGKKLFMGIGVAELFIIFMCMIVPVLLIIIAYRVGRQAGEKRILKQQEDQRRSGRT